MEPYEELFRRQLCLEVRPLGRRRASSISMTRGLLDSDATVAERLKLRGRHRLPPAGQAAAHHHGARRVRASTSRAVPGVKVPPGYRRHFQSFDGKQRTLLVEGAGGPTWYTEYNVLTGLVGALVRPLRLFRHPHRRRPRRARPAAGAARAAATRPSRSIRRYGAFLQRAAASRRPPASSASSMPATWARTASSPTASITTRRRALIAARARRAAAVHVRLYSPPTTFPWDYRYRPDLTPGLAGSRQRRPRSTNISAGRP